MKVMSEYETIRFEIRGNVAWVTLNRPQVLNAINQIMQAELADVWQRIRKAPDIHVSVLTGAGGRAFTTGADREEMTGTVEGEDATLPRSTRSVPAGAVPGGPGIESDIGERIAPKSQMCWKPVIAAVNGMACGGAFYLLGECDIIIASETATFFDPHVTYGMVSAYESIHMLQRMPIGEVLRMQLLGNYERLSAQRAWQIGLVSEVVPPAKLHDAADWVASRIASLSPAAIQGTLRAVWAAKEVSRQAALNLSPHFIAMADPAEWTAGQDTFRSGERVKPRIR
jgi:enoyl-CoA hydratase/carnithine racemase